MLKTRVITALLLLAVLLAILFLNSFPVFAIALGAFLAAAAWESFRLFGNKIPWVGAVLWTAAFALIVIKGDPAAALPLFGLCAAIWTIRLTPSLAIGLPPLQGIGNRLLNGIYGVAILGCFIATAALFKLSALYLFSVLSIVWLADIGAYFSGKALGKHKLAPSISPGKSWEGAIGGWLVVLIAAGATVAMPALHQTFAVQVQQKWGWAGFIAVMTLLVAASIVGDLFESQLKRRANMKDSSNLLPGHGGVLDRIDALIPVLPLAMLFMHGYKVADNMQHLTILGATGSIGVSTLDVLARHPDRYAVHALTAHSRIEELARQCTQFHPQVAVVATADDALLLTGLLRRQNVKTEVTYGAEALCEVARAPECDTVMAAIVGAAGLAPTLAAAKAGKKILLANKEALVMSGRLFMDAVHASGAVLLPIDSEHNAIFQCLPQHYQRTPDRHGIAKILLTASGGPFLSRAVNTLDTVTPEEAVAHPNWVMGRKISVDSATMMNKGLEVIEAHWLFGAPADRIEVVIHPQSVIHSMVSYVDGSVLAQLGNPDMRTPIAHALAYPERIESGVAPVDLARIGQLTFEKPDFTRFPCLKLAYDALEAGGTAPSLLNAANEVAVEAFLNRQIGFRMIDQLIADVMNKIACIPVTDIDALLEQDRSAREAALEFVRS